MLHIPVSVSLSLPNDDLPIKCLLRRAFVADRVSFRTGGACVFDFSGEDFDRSASLSDPALTDSSPAAGIPEFELEFEWEEFGGVDCLEFLLFRACERTGVAGDFFGGRPGPFLTGVVAAGLGDLDVESALDSLSELLDEPEEEPDADDADEAADLSETAPVSFLFCFPFWFNAVETLLAIPLEGADLTGEDGPSLSLLFSGLNMLLVLFFLSACFGAFALELGAASLAGVFF